MYKKYNMVTMKLLPLFDFLNFCFFFFVIEQMSVRIENNRKCMLLSIIIINRRTISRYNDKEKSK